MPLPEASLLLPMRLDPRVLVPARSLARCCKRLEPAARSERGGAVASDDLRASGGVRDPVSRGAASGGNPELQPAPDPCVAEPDPIAAAAR
jgi:hypothetical protein